MKPKNKKPFQKYLILPILYICTPLLMACLQPIVIPAVPTQTAIQPGGAGADARITALSDNSEQEQIILLPAPQATTWTVCTDTLYVRGAPNTMGAPTRYLTRGEVVNIREWDKRGTGWAMIAPAEWINADFLCKVTP